MKNKKIAIIAMISIFSLIGFTALSVTGMKTEAKKDAKENEVLDAKYEYSFAKIDGEVFKPYSTSAVTVRGIENFLIAKDITVNGIVPFSLTAEYEFIIDPLVGSKMIYEPGDDVDIHINTMLFPSIGLSQCTPPYINSISGLAFGVTVYE